MGILNQLYTNPKSAAGFSGVNNLLIEARKVNPKVTKKQVEEYLERSTIYTLNKPRRLRFKRLKTFCLGYCTDLHADLGDFQKLSRKNSGYKYLLLAVDVLSRKFFAAPVKSKNFKDMKNAFEQVKTGVNSPAKSFYRHRD